MTNLKIAILGPSVVSRHWNPAAPYLRGMLKYLHARGHSIDFYEPDALGRQQYRDIPDPPFARLIVYPARGERPVLDVLKQIIGADIVIKVTGIGVFDELLQEAVLDFQELGARVFLWDTDPVATTETLRQGSGQQLRSLLPEFDSVITKGGGAWVASRYRDLGAQRCSSVDPGFDPDVSHPVPPSPSFAAALAFRPKAWAMDEEESWFFEAAALRSRNRFLLCGPPVGADPGLPNVTRLEDVLPRDENFLYSTPRLVLLGSSDLLSHGSALPSSNFFEAAGAGACLVTKPIPSLSRILAAGKERIEACGGQELAEFVRSVTTAEAKAIGQAARRRMLDEHTYARRAAEFERALLETDTPDLVGLQAHLDLPPASAHDIGHK